MIMNASIIGSLCIHDNILICRYTKCIYYNCIPLSATDTIYYYTTQFTARRRIIQKIEDERHPGNIIRNHNIPIGRQFVSI